MLTIYVYKAEVKPQDGEVAKMRESSRRKRRRRGGEDKEADRDEYADDKEGV